jgi:hypothetical protein
MWKIYFCSIWTIKISSPLFSIFSLAAILVGSRDQRTHFWAIQIPFNQSLVAIGPVVSEEKIKVCGKSIFAQFHTFSTHMGQIYTIKTDLSGSVIKKTNIHYMYTNVMTFIF